MAAMNPYLNFPGNTREAMTYYQSIFGGELKIATFGDFDAEGMPADGVMHSSLVNDVFELYAADAMPEAEQTWGGIRIYLAVMGDNSDADLLTGWWQALAADGSIGMPLEKQVWGDQFGQLTDKYGLEWMFNFGEGNGA